MTRNEKLQEAIEAIWRLEGILLQKKIVEWTGLLIGEKEPTS